MSRTVVAFFSDSHANHKLGLLNPETVLYHEDQEGRLIPVQPELTATQRYLWEAYEADRAAVLAFAAGDPLVVIHNGDATQGTKYQDHLVSTRVADQVTMAVANFRPWFEMGVRTMRVVKGTGSHVLGEGSTEILIAQQLAAEFPDADVKALYHGLLCVDGVKIDYAHHGPYPGSRNWLRGNVARYYLRSYMLDEFAAGRTPADVLLRSHYHTWIPPESLGVEFRGRVHWSWLVLTPSYCGLGAYGRQATRSTHRQTHGLVALEIVDGRLGNIRPFKRSIDLRTKESL